MAKDKLQERHFWGYGVGHFLNDITNGCWLYFLIFFLNRIVKTQAAPYVFLLGQIVDGLLTPTIAVLSDRTHSRFGKRTPWYVMGFLLVSIGNFPLYIDIGGSPGAQFAYYLAFSMAWNVGWAAVQVNHLSMLPSLTQDRIRRDRLNNIRTSFVYVSNLLILSLGALIFQIMESPHLEFLLVAGISQAIGTFTSIFFLCTIRETKLAIDINPQENSEQKPPLEGEEEEKAQVEESRVGIREWLKKPSFYLCCLCYVGVKIDNSTFGVFLAFYLANVLEYGSQSRGISMHTALVPLMVYLVAIGITSQLIKLYKLMGRKKVLTMGTAFNLACLAGLFFLTPSYSGLVYYFAIFRGLSSGLVFPTGSNLVTDIIGNKGASSAFVYGFFQFVNKCVLGVVVYLVTHSEAYSKEEDFTGDELDFIRYTTCLIPGLACCLGTLGILLCPVPDYLKEPADSQTNEQLLP